MGLTLEFLILEDRDLSRVLSDPEYEVPKEGMRNVADFSLHLIPRDIDDLSVALAPFTSLPAMELRPNLIVMLDLPERGMFMVDNRWVGYVAEAKDSNVVAIAEAWAGMTGRAATSHSRRAVGNLISLCVDAQKHAVPVLHRWSV